MTGNWAGTHEYRARDVVRPTSVDELRDIVRAAESLRILGSRHGFNDLVDTDGVLVRVDGLPRTIEIDADARTVTVDGGTRYGELAVALEAAGLALHNLASLPHISVAGACATGTHGSGDARGNLATAVRSVELLTVDGALRTIRRGDAEFPAAAVSLGALGVILRLALDVEPTYRVRQEVYEDLPLAAFERHFADVSAAADSVSWFTEWRGPSFDQVWLKRRLDAPVVALPAALQRATRATRQRHPIRRLPADACTPQLGIPGPWHERLPHFRLDHEPSSGNELQSEYFVPREHAVPAVLALQSIRERIAAVIQVSEIRTIAGDDAWLSPSHGRETAAIHFTWQPDEPAVRELLPMLEARLEPFAPRPHWAKLFTMPPAAVRAAYPRRPDFVAVARRLDPEGRLANDFVRRYVLAEA